MNFVLYVKLMRTSLDLPLELRDEFLILLKIRKDLFLPFQMHRLRASGYF